MALSRHYQAARALSPPAARVAARLLEASTNIPFEWRLSLRTALADRSRFVRPSTTPEQAMPSDTDRETLEASAREAEMRSQLQAHRFIQAVEGDAESDETN